VKSDYVSITSRFRDDTVLWENVGRWRPKCKVVGRDFVSNVRQVARSFQQSICNSLCACPTWQRYHQAVGRFVSFWCFYPCAGGHTKTPTEQHTSQWAWPSKEWEWTEACKDRLVCLVTGDGAEGHLCQAEISRDFARTWWFSFGTFGVYLSYFR
jgi:hypothetical protein